MVKKYNLIWRKSKINIVNIQTTQRNNVFVNFIYSWIDYTLHNLTISYNPRNNYIRSWFGNHCYSVTVSPASKFIVVPFKCEFCVSRCAKYANSAGSANRFGSKTHSSLIQSCTSSGIISVNGVWNRPGAIATTRMPIGRNSAANDFVIASIPAPAATFATWPRHVRNAVDVDVFIMTPRMPSLSASFCAINSTPSRATLNVPAALTWKKYQLRLA